MIRLLVVDDHQPAREGAVSELGMDGIIQIIGESETSDEAYKMAAQLLPDVVLLDLHLPGLMSTDDLLKRLVGLKNVRVIVYASQSKAAEVQDLFDAGACAYVLKSDPWPLIKMSILMVSRGTRGIISPALPKNLTRLSAQERNIMRQVTKRGGLAKAAERMGITEYDLQKILEHLAEKLELENADKLMKWAKKHGF
jgi:two-component system, NarL family, nitrate/nitrite response regulator NarL